MKGKYQSLYKMSAICLVLVIVLNLSISQVSAQEGRVAVESVTTAEESTTEESTTEVTSEPLQLTEKMCQINGLKIKTEADYWYQSIENILFPSDTVKYAKIKKGTEYLFGTDREYANTDMLKESANMAELLKKFNESGTYTIQMAEIDVDGKLAAETEVVSIQVDVENPTEITIDHAPDNIWTNKGIQIKANASDETNGSGIKEYQYIYGNTGFNQTDQIMTSTDGIILVDRADAIIEEVHIRAVDHSGRTGKPIKVSLKYDSKKAILKDFKLNGKRNVTLIGNVEDVGSGIQKVECSIQCVRFQDTGFEQVKDYSVVSYEYQTGGEILNSYAVNEKWTGLTGKITYLVKVTDFAGNVTEYPADDTDNPSVNVDNIAPEGEVYISYETEYTDSSEDHDILAGACAVSEKLFFLQNSLETHKVYIYGYDADSDVKQFEVSIIDSANDSSDKEVWRGTVYTVNGESDDYVTCKIDGKSYNYACMEFPTFLSNQEFHENQIKIHSMVDTSDNVRIFGDTEGTSLTKLVGDKISPELEVELTNCKSIYGNNYYFQNDGQTLFSVNGEKYFQKGKLDTFLNGSKEEGWTKNEKGGYSWLLKQDQNEHLEETKEISIKYTDPNGNLLCAADTGVVTINKGQFEGRLIFDSKAPVLQDFGLDGEYVTDEDGIFYYTHMDAEKGMKGHIEIEENNLDYNNLEDVELRAIRLDGDKTETVVVVQWTLDTQFKEKSQPGKLQQKKYIGTFDFNQEGKYKLVLAVKDKSDNKMEADQAGNLLTKEGVYESQVFVIDHTAPVLCGVTYGTPEQITDLNGNTVLKEGPEFETISYYQGKHNITVKIKENYFFEKEFHFYVNGEKIPANKLSWHHEENVHTGIFQMQARDGEYQMTCDYVDKAGLALKRDVSIDENLFDDEKHKYAGPLFVIDTIDPVISYVKDDNVAREFDGRKYYKQTALFRIVVEEKNFRVTNADIQLVVSAKDSSDKTVREAGKLLKEWNEKINDIANWKQAGEKWIFDILLDVDANYTVTTSYTDLAKRNVSNVCEKVTIDTGQPYVDKVTFKKADTDKLTNFINYITYGYFARGKIRVDITYKDDIGGISNLEYYAVENGEKVEPTKEEVTKGNSVRKASFLLPQNFKGYVVASVEDNSKNLFTSSYKGAVSENTDKHNESGSITIAPQKEGNKNGFYNSSVFVDLKIQDNHSAIKNYSYTAGNSEKGSHSYEKDAGKDPDSRATEAETYAWNKEVVLKGVENDNNHVKVKVDYEDNAGNKDGLEKEYKIDVTKPEITIQYDNNDAQNEKYYKADRIATITVKERNFDEDDFHIIFTTTGPKPKISAWQHTKNAGESNDALHTCKVKFWEDGDYTLTVKGQDMAGNKADYNRVDEFTVDKTVPVISVIYSNNDARNQYYYKAPRTAHITIEEHNFDESGVQVTMSGKNSGKQIAGPVSSRYKISGDKNASSIEFNSDGEYTWGMNYTDKAGNKAKTYGKDHFIIDFTKPVVKIFDVEDKVAYKGRIAPGIEYTDNNYDADGVTVTLFGYKTGSKNLIGTNTAITNGRRIRMANFEQKKEVDDLYVLSASVVDKAGNREKSQVTFSVNRFGSVYVLDTETEELVEQYYTNEEKRIGFTEINVDSLCAKEVAYNKDGSVHSLEVDTDYTVKESTNSNKWKEYHYEIPASVFAEEGVYEILVYSEDNAGNKSDNVIKGTPVEFAIDKTNPMAVIAGVTDKERYNVASRELVIDVKDNLGVVSIKVHYGDKVKQFSAKQIQKAGGAVGVTAKASNHWQKVYAEVMDVAGNSITTEPIEFLLTPNLLIQFYNNKAALYFSMGAVILLLCLSLFLWAKKKKRWR